MAFRIDRKSTRVAGMIEIIRAGLNELTGDITTL